MKVLVVGRGGREHSLMTHLAESEQVSELFAAPGNGGIAKLGTCVDIDEIDIDGLVQFVKKKKIDFTVRSEEHTSELQSRGHLVCRLLLEKKKKTDVCSNS